MGVPVDAMEPAQNVPVPESVLRHRAANRKWSAANPDKVREMARRRYARIVAADPDYNMRNKAAYIARDPERYYAQRAAQKERAQLRVLLASVGA